MTTESMKRKLEATRLLNHLIKPCESTHSQFKATSTEELLQLIYDMSDSDKMYMFEYLFYLTQR